MPSFPYKFKNLTVTLAVLLVSSIGFARNESSDRFGVVGVIAQKSSPQSKQSLAVIRDSQTNRNLVVRVGDKVPGGFVVKSIKQGEVRITADGKDFVLSPKSFDGVSAVASNETVREPVEFDDSDIEEEFVEPPPAGSPPGTAGERYTMSPGEVRAPPPPTQEYSTRRNNVPPPAPPPPTQDGFGRPGMGAVPPPPMPPLEGNFDNSFSGYEDLFEGP